MVGSQTSAARPKIAFFAGGDPLDPTLWSGTPYHALQALREVADVVYVEREPYPRWWNKAGRAVLKASGGRVDPRMVRSLVKRASAPARERLLASGADTYVSFAGSGMASFIPECARQVLFSDATSKAIIGYYGSFSGLLPSIRAQFIAMESEAMRKAAVVSYPSEWACTSAAQDFDGLGEKIRLIPWGPNMAAPENVAPRQLGDGPMRLLFVGIDWERKGGEIALEAARLLHEQGFACQLDVVGVTADRAKGTIPPNATFHGRLYQSDPAQSAKLAALFEHAHLFILPTRAEALGMVFAESAARGIPSLAYATGGVTTVVKHGETGELLDLSAGAPQFAAAIRALADDPARYAVMSKAALDDSQQRLNWPVWARAVVRLL